MCESRLDLKMSELLQDMKGAEARNEIRISKYRDKLSECQRTIEEKDQRIEALEEKLQ